LAERSTDVTHDERRRHRRVPGPFDGLRLGLIDTPVRMYDLSVGGCFVNTVHEQTLGVVCKFQIDLGEEGPVTIRGRIIYLRSGFGYAVEFVEPDDSTRALIARAVARIEETRTAPER
jgi:hypothetical protein